MFSNDKNVETIAQLVEVLKHYIGLQSEYMKLDVIEKVVRLLTVITIMVVFCTILLISLIYKNTPTQRFSGAFNVGANVLDGLILTWKLYRMFGGKQSSGPFNKFSLFKKKKK